MKLLNIPFLVLVLSAAVCGLASADDKAPATNSQATAAPTEKKVESFQVKTVSGKILAADENAKVLKLEDDGKNQHVFKITSTTKITVNGQQGRLSDMGPGMQVSVVPAEYPSNADTISATGDAPAKPTYDFSHKSVFKSKKKK